ncbi:MAG: GapR family DNA-binding domain-containing protein, partial [Cypionkella sp.]
MNDVTAAYTVTADELRQFIERAEQLASEKKDV